MIIKKLKNKNLSIEQYGSIVFGVGLLISIISAFFDFENNVSRVILASLVIFGITIGILNIRKKEVNSFLISSLFLIIVSIPLVTVQGAAGAVFSVNVITFLVQSIFNSQYLLTVLTKMFVYLLTLISSAAIFISLKTIFMTAKDD